MNVARILSPGGSSSSAESSEPNLLPSTRKRSAPTYLEGFTDSSDSSDDDDFLIPMVIAWFDRRRRLSRGESHSGEEEEEDKDGDDDEEAEEEEDKDGNDDEEAEEEEAEDDDDFVISRYQGSSRRMKNNNDDGEGEEEEDKDGNDDEEQEEEDKDGNRSEVPRLSIEESKQGPDSYVSVSNSRLREMLLAANSLIAAHNALTAAHAVFETAMHEFGKSIRQVGECSKKHKEVHEVVLQVKERSLKFHKTEEGQNKESSAKGREQDQTVNDQRALDIATELTKRASLSKNLEPHPSARVTSLTGIGMGKSSTSNIQKALGVQIAGEKNEDYEDEEVEDNEQLLEDAGNAFEDYIEEDESDA